MGEALDKRLQQSRKPSVAAEAILNLMVAADYVRGEVDAVCGPHGITRTQYNVLRILRGAGEDGHPRCEIARRMVERAPDITRLIDRLEERGLAERVRSQEDRRLSVTRITEGGTALLAQVEPVLRDWEKRLSARLSGPELRELSRLCELVYASEE